MKTRYLVALFAVGLTVMAAAFVVGWARSRAYVNTDLVMQIILGLLGADVVLLGVIGIAHERRARWLALLFASILILGFSVLALFSIGWMTALPALTLLAVAIGKLRHYTKLPHHYPC